MNVSEESVVAYTQCRASDYGQGGIEGVSEIVFHVLYYGCRLDLT